MGNLSTRLRSSSPWSRRLTQRSLESRRPRTVTVDYNRLELFLNDFVATRAKRGESLGWLGLITGLVAALVSADFNYQDTRLGLTGAQWQTLFVAALVLAVIGLIRSTWSALAGPSIRDFLTALWSDAGVAVQERALFLVKKSRPGDGKLLLVYRSPTWGCDLIPNVRLDEVTDLSGLSTILADQLGVESAEVSVLEFEAARLLSTKYSIFYGQEITYEFRFYLATFAESSSVALHADKFAVRGREFSWKSLAEMQNDPEISRRNGDVLKYISERSQLLLFDPPDSISTSSLGSKE